MNNELCRNTISYEYEQEGIGMDTHTFTEKQR